MPRKRAQAPLRVLLNNRPMGRLLKEASGAVSFRYDESWLSWPQAAPLSLSMPLREDAYRGEAVIAFCENLLPDAESLLRRIAERVGAKGSDAYTLLSEIGRDCVGALQFVPENVDAPGDTSAIHGEIVSEPEIEALLNSLARAPLGMDEDQGFRISVAGAQEKTALLRHDGRWWKPRGGTPTTHLFKRQIGTLPNGIDLSNSVENEYYCLKLLAGFGLPVPAAEIQRFGGAKALVVERFDRRWTADHRLIRIPQEDCCQALSVPPSRKYQSQGGPRMIDVLELLRGSDTPSEDQGKFLKAQVLFWLIGATDGHAKNFSVFLGAGGRFHLTPFYDVLTAQPSQDSHHVERKQMKLAMSVGDARHYRLDEIRARHFVQTAERAKWPTRLAQGVLEEIADTAESVMSRLQTELPEGFPEGIHRSVMKGLRARLART